MSGIFAKTAKGQEEIDKRTNDMPLRMRRVLILVDGKRSIEEIQAMSLADDLQQTLDFLEKNGFIEPGGPAVALEASAEDNLVKFTFREVSAQPDPEDMEKARHFIINTLKTFCGPMTHLSIVKAVSAANTHQELRESFIPWYNAIIETGSGRRRAEELSELLLKVI